MKKGTRIEITWIDSTAYPGWSYFDNESCSEIMTVGYYVDQNKQRIHIAQSISDSGRMDGRMSIPNSVIKNIRILKTKKKLNTKPKK